MIHPIKAIDAVRRVEGEPLDIAEKYEVIDTMWGLSHFKFTDDDIKLLKEGKYLYCNNGEYATIISYDGGKKEEGSDEK